MNQKKMTFNSSLILVLGVLITGCSNQPVSNISEAPAMDVPVMNEMVPEAPVSDNNMDPAMDMMGGEVKMDKAGVEALVFNKNFTSNRYYNEVQNLVESIQRNIVQEEVSNSKNTDSCSKLSKEASVNECSDSFNYTQGIVAKDLSFCDKVLSEERQKNCKYEVSFSIAKSEGNVEFCDSLEEEYRKNDCLNSIYMDQAQSNLDAELCEKIADEGFRMMCDSEVKWKVEEKERQVEMEAQQAEAMQAAEAVLEAAPAADPELAPETTP